MRQNIGFLQINVENQTDSTCCITINNTQIKQSGTMVCCRIKCKFFAFWEAVGPKNTVVTPAFASQRITSKTHLYDTTEWNCLFCIEGKAHSLRVRHDNTTCALRSRRKHSCPNQKTLNYRIIIESTMKLFKIETNPKINVTFNKLFHNDHQF